MIPTLRKHGNTRRRAVAKGQDIYAITAPLACAAVGSLLEGKFRLPGANAPPTERQAEEVAGPEKGNVFEIVGNGSSTSMRFDYIAQSKRKHTSGSS